MKCLITDGLGKDGLDIIKSTKNLTTSYYEALEKEQLQNEIQDCDILIVRSRTKVDKTLFSYAKKLKLVIRAGIGLDNIDMHEATHRGVIVMNAPTGNIVTTAEHTLALMFAISRQIPQADASIRKKLWEKKKFQGHELRGKTLGIIGLGNIGKALARMALGLDMKVVAYDPYLTSEVALKLSVTSLSLVGLLSESDYISVHVPLTESTKHLINLDNIHTIKKGAYLINCSRGGVIDEKAALMGLEKGIVRGCAFDVFEQEPIPPDHPFLSRSDIVLTPHLGASTDEALQQVGYEVGEQVRGYVEKGILSNAVNVPNLSTEQIERLKYYLILCERMGSFLSQFLTHTNGNLYKIHIRYRGVGNNDDRDIFTLSLLKGLLDPLLTTTINFVNVRKILESRGIEVEISHLEHEKDYGELIELTIVENDGKTLSCSGALFGKKAPRLIQFNGSDVDIVLEGHLLYCSNEDKPGVIGALGTVLSKNHINIGRLYLVRENDGRAFSISHIDSLFPLDTTILDQLKKIDSVHKIFSIFIS